MRLGTIGKIAKASHHEKQEPKERPTTHLLPVIASEGSVAATVCPVIERVCLPRPNRNRFYTRP